MTPKSLLGRNETLALVIVKEEQDFNHPTRSTFSHNYRLRLLSAETCITEGLLQNNFHHLLGPRHAFHNFSGRQVLHLNPLIDEGIAQRFALHADAHGPGICDEGHGLASL